MRTISAWILGLLFAAPAAVCGQNLVPNGSFEDYMGCPDALGDIGQALGWETLCASPDYYHTCSDTSVTDVPSNAFGYQYPKEGDAYIGIYTYKTNPTNREHVQAALSAPLIPGQVAYLTMSLATGGFGNATSYDVRLAARGVGMRFSTQPLQPGTNLTNDPVLFIDQVLADTLNWMTLSGTFIPDSAFAYIQLGNFFADSLSSPALLDPNGITDGAYSFIDVVCVSQVPGVCYLGDGIDEVQYDRLIFTISSEGDNSIVTLARPHAYPVRLVVFDVEGRDYWSSTLEAGEVSQQLPMASFAPGVYFLRATTNRGIHRTLKFLHF